MVWIRLAPQTALPEGEAVRVDLDEQQIALFHVAGHFYAVEDSCLHMGGPLSEGTVDGRTVRCPWHQWCYDLVTGQRLDRRGGVTRTYPVEVRDGWICLDPGDLAAGAARPAAPDTGEYTAPDTGGYTAPDTGGYTARPRVTRQRQRH